MTSLKPANPTFAEVKEAMSAPAPGVYSEVPFDSYLKWPMLNPSAIIHGRDSMKHLRRAWLDNIRDEPTDDMLLGSVLHCAFLEPELMPSRVALWEKRRYGNEWEAFKAANAGKIILTATMHEKLVGMTRSLRAACREYRQLREWYNRIEAVEISAVGEVHGVLVKGRIDALTPSPLFDIKKVNNGDMRLFQSKAYSLGYHIRAFVYCELFKRDRFIFITVEDFGDYDVVCYEADKAMMRRGAEEACEIIERVAVCQQTGKWPGRSEQIEEMSLPTYALSDVPESSGMQRAIEKHRDDAEPIQF